jgi:hypothetical protein
VDPGFDGDVYPARDLRVGSAPGPSESHVRAIASLVLCASLVAAAAPVAATPDGTPVRIQTLGSWRTHDPSIPIAGAEPWTPADVAGFMALYPTAYLDLGVRDAQPPGNRYWLDKGREVDQLQALVGGEGRDALSRICVTERPDVQTKMLRERSCDPSAGGGGCDWEGDMDGAHGESERVLKHAGIASGGEADRVSDRTASWQAARWRHRLLVLRPGGASEERRRIVASGASSLTVEPAWEQPPSAGDRYEIRGSFDPRWVKRVPRAAHEATVRELWTARRNVCGSPGAPRPCRGPAEPLDPFHPANRRAWGGWIDRAAIEALATPSAVPALYGPVQDAAHGPGDRDRTWTDPFFEVSTVVMDLADPAYRDWRIRYLMYKLEDYGLARGEPACINLTYKPGWYTHYDEATRGPSGDACAVPKSGLWTGPAHVCRDGTGPGGPFVAGLYGPGEYERAVNSYIRELIARLREAGWSQLRILLVERPTFTPALWTILDDDVRRHPAVIGEWLGPIDPKLAQLRNRPAPDREQAAAPPPAQAPNAPPPTPAPPAAPPAESPPTTGAGGASPPGPDAPAPATDTPRPRGSVTSSRGGGGAGGVIEPPSADR